MIDFGDYTRQLYNYTPIRLKPRPDKICRQVCPNCGKKNVNIYYVGQLKQYICKKCLDKYVRRDD